jgi:DNA polymerase-3 subunit epsilon
MREIVLDTETTGLNPKAGDRVVEIACLELVNRIPTGKTWHEYLNPEREMPKAAFDVHGLSTEFLATKPLFSALANDFLEFISDATLVIHNASFDIGFLNHELGLLGLPPIGMDRVVDTLAIARRKHPGAPNSLDALCKRYSIDASSRTVHGALIDTELLAEVYVTLIGGHQARLDLDPGGGNEWSQNASLRARLGRPAPLPPRITPDEMEAHRAFVESLGPKRVWTLYDGGDQTEGQS